MNFINTIIILIIVIVVINYLTNGNIKKYVQTYAYRCLNIFKQKIKTVLSINEETSKNTPISEIKNILINKPKNIPINKPKNILNKPKKNKDLILSIDLEENKLNEDDDILSGLFINSNENNNNIDSDDSLIPSIELTEYEEKSETELISDN